MSKHYPDLELNFENDIKLNTEFKELEDGTVKVVISNAKEEDKMNEASENLKGTLLDEAMTLVDVVSYVPSDMLTGVLGVVNMFIPSSSN